ncbi:hypothetical protein BIFGAL_03911 [Bifidobacterium gallicum DSM 20093 = LMG 11596]|uniref:Uncharacterized protein n=1 Tax=Bifidobacterium gallicum DSM 20093 = LMG 11596 TaxID=561180 RepID=D1NVM1_9BIFI|nr:hypothetical protein BIFGAL_03911 [Bifidobacterium gallicum DSM 20093 = LMG 11596]
MQLVHLLRCTRLKRVRVRRTPETIPRSRNAAVHHLEQQPHEPRVKKPVHNRPQ